MKSDMSTNRRYIIGFFSFLLTLGLSACFPEDEQLLPPPSFGQSKQIVLPLESDYRNQVYFDFSTGEISSQNLRSESDLWFDSRPLNKGIRLNSARAMAVAEVLSSDFASVIDTAGMHFRHDAPTGNPDSTAFGTLLSSDRVFVVNRGYNYLNEFNGFKKLQFIESAAHDYHFRLANLDGSEEQLFSIDKEPGMNFVYFSMDEGGKLVHQEPGIEAYDLLATVYTELIPDPSGTMEGIYPYQVTGLLLNPTGVSVAVEQNISYDSIDLLKALDFEYYHNLNVIGYGWKQYGFTSGMYEVFDNLCYILLDAEGNYYKIRFLDFYNEAGEKGYIKFEYQVL